MGINTYRAQSAIDEQKRVAEEKAEAKRIEAEGERAANERLREYAALDKQYAQEEQVRLARTEAARRERQELEREAVARADKMEREADIDRRAQQILAERQALMDPSVARAYDVSSAVRDVETKARNT